MTDLGRAGVYAAAWIPATVLAVIAEGLATATFNATPAARSSSSAVGWALNVIPALVADAYVVDAAVRDFVAAHNPAALRGMLERLLEAMQRGLWEEPGDYRQQLEDLLLAHEDQQEGLR